MDPITAGLFMAASFGVSLLSSKTNYKIEAANLTMQVEQSRLQTAEAAYERTKNFRKQISTNLALSGMGVGGTTGFRAASASGFADFQADMSSLGRQDLFAQLGGTVGRAANKANRFSNIATGALNAVSLSQQLGLFQSGGTAKTKSGGTAKTKTKSAGFL